MSSEFQFSDMHCHPNLKTYGHSFSNSKFNKRKDVWYRKPPSFFTRLLNVTTGITKFSQADFTTLSKGGAKIIFASLYPFEKGFFINAAGDGSFSAGLSNFITDIGFNRVRNLQKHTDYFNDLEHEYMFFKESQKKSSLEGQEYSWRLIGNRIDLSQTLNTENEIAVILSIEGAHVFNSGLSNFGRKTEKDEVIANIQKVKQWEHPPFYITFAHNFYNDLCGHARSLEPIKRFVDQNNGMETGFTDLGIESLHELLSTHNGRRIYIDIKHMSKKSRIEYFNILKSDYPHQIPPTIVSHGAVNGLSLTGRNGTGSDFFYHSDINFFDEEIEQIGKYGGLFAIQFDTRRIANPKFVKKSFGSLFKEDDSSAAVEVIWQQLKYIVELLDRNEIFGWGIPCIGSDYDGTINPLPGIWTAEYFVTLQELLLNRVSEYLKNPNPLTIRENKNITPEEVLERFFYSNTKYFVEEYY